MAKRKQTVAEKRQAVISEAADKASDIESLATNLLDSFDVAVEKWAAENIEDISKIEEIISDVNEKIADLKGELDEIKSNMEDRFSGTERYQRLDELVNQLDSVPEMSMGVNSDTLDRQRVADFLEGMDDLIGQAADVSGILNGISVEG